jgi:hypothetical protein
MESKTIYQERHNRHLRYFHPFHGEEAFVMACATKRPVPEGQGISMPVSADGRISGGITGISGKNVKSHTCKISYG